MPIDLRQIDVDWLILQYDIQKEQHRALVRDACYRAGGELMTQSVFMMPYSPQAHEEIKQIEGNVYKQLKAQQEKDRKEGKKVVPITGNEIRIIITPSSFSTESFAFWKSRYEELFSTRFEQAQQTLEFIEDALDDKVQWHDRKKEKPDRNFTGEEILARVRSVDVFLEDCRTALVKRQERDGKKDKQLALKLKKLERRLNEMDSHSQKLAGAAKARKVREANGGSVL